MKALLWRITGSLPIVAAALTMSTVRGAGYHLFEKIPVPRDYGWDNASADKDTPECSLVEKVATEIGARGRGPMVPGSFHVLVFGE